jgi:hypothetical protein
MPTSKVNQNFFVEPGCNVQKGDEGYVTLARLDKEQLKERWNSQSGNYILNTWRANRFDRVTLEGLVGKFYDQVDLRGISLVKEDLTGADLSQVDLYAANLEGSKLDSADLNGSFLSEANLKGVTLNWAKMQDVLIDNASFDNRTSFTGVRLSSINFTLAEHLKDFAFGQQRIANLESKYPRVAFLLWLTCDYGRSFPRFLMWCGGMVLGFAILYAVVPQAISKTGFWNSLYFSIMTFTTTGSEIQAMSPWGKILVSIEASIGFLMTGLLVSILVKRTIGD